MARIKRHRNARSQGMSRRRRKPNICKLIYKFLVTNQAAYDTERATEQRWRDEEIRDNKVVESADTSQRIIRDKMGTRRNHGKVTKSRNQYVLKDLPISYLQKCVSSEGTTKARKYIRKALDFGVESGFLIPSDSSYKVLRVSSDLMKSDTRNMISTCDRALSKDRNIPTKLDDLQEQRRRRRRRRGRSPTRSRSRSRRRRRRRRRRRGRRRRRSRGSRSRSRSRSKTTNVVSPQNPEEVVENEANDYEMDENDPKSDIHTDGTGRESKTARSSKHDDDEELAKKSERNRSDLSADEDESDDDDDDDDNDENKKRIDIANS